jgi:hypothetical protein
VAPSGVEFMKMTITLVIVKKFIEKEHIGHPEVKIIEEARLTKI